MGLPTPRPLPSESWGWSGPAGAQLAQRKRSARKALPARSIRCLHALLVLACTT